VELNKEGWSGKIEEGVLGMVRANMGSRFKTDNYLFRSLVKSNSVVSCGVKTSSID